MNDLKEHPYFKLFFKVQKPARYLGKEKGSIIKKNATLKMVFCFPDIYEIAMSNTGLKILYEKVNAHPELSMQRCFTPWSDMEEELKKENLPLISLETFTPIKEFDVVGFSLCYELTYTNILTMLFLGKIPFFSSERDKIFPLLIGGGIGAFNPEPLSPFFDFFLLGDGEELLLQFLLALKDLKKKNALKNEIIKELSKIEGVYSPLLNEGFCKVKKSYVDLKKHPLPQKIIIPWVRPVFERSSFEISRGCVQGCRFCQAGYLYRPLRERKPDEIFSIVQESIEKEGEDEISLMSLSTADYFFLKPLIISLMDYLSGKNTTISISSLRPYGIDKEVLMAIKKVRKAGLTFAPEAGSEKLRKIINKDVSESEFLQGVETAFSSGWQRIKLYFMIGLPTETDQDVLSICNLVKRVKMIGEKYHGKRTKITVSVSTFVPKPHTPFQWVGMEKIEEILRKQEILKKNLRVPGIELKWHNAKMSIIECVLGRGDNRLGGVILKAWQRGCRLDGWEEKFQWNKWVDAFRECNIDMNDYLKEIPINSPLPWDKIDTGISKKFLLNELKRALVGVPLPPCYTAGKKRKSFEENLEDLKRKKIICYNCGLMCDTKNMRQEKLSSMENLEKLKNLIFENPITDEYFLYEIKYAKIASASLISHLDFISIFPLILRKSSLNLKYSKGFHPMPAISYENPLPLGIQSLSQKVMVEIKRIKNESEVLLKLNENSLPGLTFLSIKELKDKNAFIKSDFLTYFVGIKDYDEDVCNEKIKEIKMNKNILIYYEKNNRRHSINIKEFIEEIEISDTEKIDPLKILPFKEKGIIIKLKNVEKGFPKIEEIIENLFEKKVIAYEIIKI